VIRDRRSVIGPKNKTLEEIDMAYHSATAASVTLAAALAFSWSSAIGQDYPSRPIRLIVPQSAGGSTDLIARLLAQKMSDTLGQTIVVDNRPGAGSVNGTETAAKAAPDGYTLLTVAASFTITPALHRKLPFDSVRDFAPLTQVATLPHIVIVHPSVPVKSVKDLIALAKAKPGELNVATSGIATSTHLAAELFMHLTDTKMVMVPYKGGSPSMTAMLAGQCQVNFAAMSTAIPHVRSGKVRAIAISSAKRSAAAPEYPTIAEAGVPGYAHSSWVGLLAPAKTPRAIVTRLSTEAIKAAEAPDTKPYLLKFGMEPVGSSPAEFAALIRTEIAKWQKVVKAAGITTGISAE
jgi:tripartite-type tricarboxylate transporter receptor subunit TctC